MLQTQLYGVSGHNVSVTAVSIGVLGFSALVASAVPAVRASRIPPAAALRAE
jgi:ABC-type lipoprotein release transport system permease subunit